MNDLPEWAYERAARGLRDTPRSEVADDVARVALDASGVGDERADILLTLALYAGYVETWSLSAEQKEAVKRGRRTLADFAKSGLRPQAPDGADAEQVGS